MKLALGILAALIVVSGLIATGALISRTVDATWREATANSLLMGARSKLANGSRSEAIFMVGSATALNPTAFVLLAAGDVLLDADERSLARDVLVRALSEAASTDPKLEFSIKSSLDRVAQKKAFPSSN